MAKYAFNHDSNDLLEAFGFTEEHMIKMAKTVLKAQIDGETQLDTMEISMNEVDPKNMVEAMYLGYIIGMRYGTLQARKENPLSRLFSGE